MSLLRPFPSRPIRRPGWPGIRLVVALAPAGEHLDGRGYDLGLPVTSATVVVPLPGLQPALDGHLLSLAQVLAADLFHHTMCFSNPWSMG